jgi:hypothetical protein
MLAPLRLQRWARARSTTIRMALADRLDEAHRYSMCPKSLCAPRPTATLSQIRSSQWNQRSGLRRARTEDQRIETATEPVGKGCDPAVSCLVRCLPDNVSHPLCHKCATRPSRLFRRLTSDASPFRHPRWTGRCANSADQVVAPSLRREGAGCLTAGYVFDDLDRLPADLIYRNMDHEREDAMELTVRGPPAGRRSEVLAFFSIVDRRRRLHRQVCAP